MRIKQSVNTNLLVLTCLAVLLAACGEQLSNRENGSGIWKQAIDLGLCRAMQTPEHVNVGDATYVIWQGPYPDLDLQLSVVNQEASTPVHLLPYPDVKPKTWKAVQATNTTFHLLWTEEDGRLQSALINTAGETLRGPVTLSLQATPEFAVASLASEAFVVWIPYPGQPPQALLFDIEGRPQPLELPNIQNPHGIAVLAQEDRSITLAWIEERVPLEYTFKVISGKPNSLTSAVPNTVAAPSLEPGEYIQDLGLGSDKENIYLWWSVSNADDPGNERPFIASFTSDTNAPIRVQEIRLPSHLTSSRTRSDSTTPYLTWPSYKTANTTDAAPIRWINATSSGEVLAITLAAKLNHKWLPSVLYIKNSEILGWEPISTVPANAGPIGAEWSTTGQLTTAWGSLSNSVPHLFVSSSP